MKAVNLDTITAKQREQIIATMSCADVPVEVVSLKTSDGKAITNEIRDELLAKCAKNEYVELTLDVLAYEQFADKPNRNFVRIADNAMSSFGKTGKGRPFLRDHQHNNTLAVCGMITACDTADLGGGHFQVNEKVSLTAPWAVDMALRNLLSTVSISWRATGPVNCSVCNQQVFTKCWHCPGDKLSAFTDDQGVKRFKFDRSGGITVQWVYSSAEILETSPVPVPAVPSARIDRIKQSLGLDPDVELDADLPTLDPAPTLQENTTMTEAEIAALQARLAKAEKINTLSDAEKSFFNRLNGTRADSFLAASAADRAEQIKPIYTSTMSGAKFDASHDPQIIEMAKMMDAQGAAMTAQLKSANDATLAARANAELGHMAGTAEERAALLGAIDSISDAEVRKTVLGMVTAHDEKLSSSFKRVAAAGGKKPTRGAGDPEAELSALVAAAMDKDDLEEDEAHAQVMATEKGVELYNKVEAAKIERRSQLAGN